MSTATGARLPRLLALVPWLVSHDGATLAETATHFGISQKTLIADLDLLVVSGPGQFHGELLDIWYVDDDGNPDPDGRITVQDPLSLTRPLRLRPDEASALLVGLRVLDQVPGGHDRAAVATATAKLQDATADVADAAARVDVSLSPGASTHIRAVVDQAIAEHRRLRVTHASATRDEVTVRDVDPLSIVVQDGRQYLRGWCYRAEAMRTFRLDRIQDAEVLAEAVVVPDQPDVDFGTGMLRPDGPPLVLDLVAAARWVADEYPVDEVRELDNGGLRVTLPISDQRWAVRLLLRLGDHATIVTPESLRTVVREQAALALAAYDLS